MSFLLLCFFLALVVQILFLCQFERLWVRMLPLLLEMFPLSGILYYGIKQPSSFIWSWQDNVIFCIYIAVAIALGCGAAWIVFIVRKK